MYTYHFLIQLKLFFATDVLVESNIVLCTSWSLFQFSINILKNAKCKASHA